MVADKELVLFEQIGDVGIVRLNDPDTLNAVSLEMCEQIDATIDRCTASCRAMVLTWTPAITMRFRQKRSEQ